MDVNGSWTKLRRRMTHIRRSVSQAVISRTSRCVFELIDTHLLITYFDEKAQQVYALSLLDGEWRLPRHTLSRVANAQQAPQLDELFARLNNAQLSVLATELASRGSLHDLPKQLSQSVPGTVPAARSAIFFTHCSESLGVDFVGTELPTEGAAHPRVAWLAVDVVGTGQAAPTQPIADCMHACLAAARESILDHAFFGGQVVVLDHGAELCAPRGAAILEPDAFRVHTDDSDARGPRFSFEAENGGRPLRLRVPQFLPESTLRDLSFYACSAGETREQEQLIGGTFSSCGYADVLVHASCTLGIKVLSADEKRRMLSGDTGRSRCGTRTLFASIENLSQTKTFLVIASDRPKSGETDASDKEGTLPLGLPGEVVVGASLDKAETGFGKTRKEIVVSVPSSRVLFPGSRLVLALPNSLVDVEREVFSNAVLLDAEVPARGRFCWQNLSLAAGDEETLDDANALFGAWRAAVED